MCLCAFLRTLRCSFPLVLCMVPCSGWRAFPRCVPSLGVALTSSFRLYCPQAQREAEKAERESQAQTINMDAQLMLAKEVTAGASSILATKDAGSSGIASMVAGLRGGESSDSSDSDED